MLKTKVIYIRQFWLLSGAWWYFNGEGVKSWNQSILTCDQTFQLSHFDMTCWQHWHFDVILLSWPHKATASKCEISVLLPNKMCTPGISESYPPLISIFPDTPYLPMDVCFRVVHIFYSSQFNSVVSNSATLWTVNHHVPLAMEFSRQEYYSSCHFLLQRIFPTPGTEPRSLASAALAGRFFTTSATWEAPQTSAQLCPTQFKW